MKVKVQQLLREHAHASILNGAPVQTFKPDSWWFQRWQEDYGLSLRQASRKFAVPRSVLKERLELFWVSLFKLVQLAVLALGYDPMQLILTSLHTTTMRVDHRTRQHWECAAARSRWWKATATARRAGLQI